MSAEAAQQADAHFQAGAYRQAREAVQYGERDLALLQARLARHLRHDFGYAGVASAPRQLAPAREGVRAVA